MKKRKGLLFVFWVKNCENEDHSYALLCLNGENDREDQMEERKWEDLSTDCLVDIFGRLGVESLLLDVSLVCKPWYQAALSPLCWQRLVFPFEIFESRICKVGGRFRKNGLIQLVVNRSQRCATSLVLSSQFTTDELEYVSDECPALKYLDLPWDVVYRHWHIIPGLISKWKSLEILRLGNISYNLVEILYQISLHCKNFVSLVVTRAYIANETASKIVTSLPNIKYLVLNNSTLFKEGLVMILQGCKELVQLDVRNCIGFDEDDDEIIKLASQINNFCCEGSYAYKDDYYPDELGDDYYPDELGDDYYNDELGDDYYNDELGDDYYHNELGYYNYHDERGDLFSD